MVSKNVLLSKSGIVEGPKEEVVKVKTPIDELPDIALPTWMRHKTLKSKLVNTKVEYYSAADEGYVEAPGE